MEKNNIVNGLNELKHLKFSPYSISKMKTFDCGLKFKLQYIDKIKIKKETNKALIKGRYIHSVIEKEYNYDIPFNIDRKPITNEIRESYNKILKTFEDSELAKKYEKFREKGKHEYDFGLEYDFNENKFIPSHYWNKKATLRGKIDFIYFERDDEDNQDSKDSKILNLIDWKTGNMPIGDVNDDQTKLYALYSFIKFEDINEIKAKFVYIEHSKEVIFTYKREQLNEISKYFLEYMNKIEIAGINNDFRPKINPFCDYCDFEKAGYCNERKRLENALEEEVIL